MRLNKENTDRHMELSSKLIEMGQSLSNEGHKDKDYSISQTGTFMILLGGLLFDENDIQQFGVLCSMFSAKKVLDNMEATQSPMTEILKKKSGDESYDDFIKRINKLREDNGHDPLG